MEPQLPAPHATPEMGPSAPRFEAPSLQSERSPEAKVAPKSPEVAAERQDQTEHRNASFDNSGAPTPVAPAMPAPVVGASADEDQHAVPAVAADDDLIEQEWVKKAKQVIDETKHDPYLQEQAVSRLQADYLQKRYGKTIKLSSE